MRVDISGPGVSVDTGTCDESSVKQPSVHPSSNPWGRDTHRNAHHTTAKQRLDAHWQPAATRSPFSLLWFQS